MVRIPRKRVAARILPMGPPSSLIQVMELDSTKKEVELDERDHKIGELQH